MTDQEINLTVRAMHTFTIERSTVAEDDEDVSFDELEERAEDWFWNFSDEFLADSEPDDVAVEADARPPLPERPEYISYVGRGVNEWYCEECGALWAGADADEAFGHDCEEVDDGE